MPELIAAIAARACAAASWYCRSAAAIWVSAAALSRGSGMPAAALRAAVKAPWAAVSAWVWAPPVSAAGLPGAAESTWASAERAWVSWASACGEEMWNSRVPAATRWPSRTKTASTVPVAGAVTVVVAAACTVAGASTTSLTVDRPTAATWMPDELPVHPVSSDGAHGDRRGGALARQPHRPILGAPFAPRAREPSAGPQPDTVGHGPRGGGAGPAAGAGEPGRLPGRRAEGGHRTHRPDRADPLRAGGGRPYGLARAVLARSAAGARLFRLPGDRHVRGRGRRVRQPPGPDRRRPVRGAARGRAAFLLRPAVRDRHRRRRAARVRAAGRARRGAAQPRGHRGRRARPLRRLVRRRRPREIRHLRRAAGLDAARGARTVPGPAAAAGAVAA